MRALMILCVTFALIGCGDDNKSKTPKAPQGAEDNSGDATGDNQPGTTPVTDDPGTPTASNPEIKPLSASGTTFEFDGGDPIAIEFEVTGDGGATIAVALIDAPSGAQLRGANSSRPTFSWTSPTNGTHSFRFLLRDMDACQAAEGSLDRCRLEDSVDGSQGSYDTTSDRYTVKVGGGDSTDISSDNTGLGGDNNDLINQILQGFGGGNADLAGLLQGLSGGQLQQILQGQGSGLDLSTLIQLVQGFGLSTNAAGQTP